MSEKELIIGMAIGDGCITKHGNLVIKHSIKQKDYCLYKKNLLLDSGIRMGKDRIVSPNTNSFCTNDSYIITTTCTNLGKQIRTYMYKDGTKIIPNDLEITPFMWSLIYQDDGRQNISNHYNKYKDGNKIIVYTKWVNRYTIYTDSFDINSINNLRNSLLSYGIESVINYSNKNHYPHIHIRRKDSKEKFRSLIYPYMCNSMLYKLNVSPSIISD